MKPPKSWTSRRSFSKPKYTPKPYRKNKKNFDGKLGDKDSHTLTNEQLPVYRVKDELIGLLDSNKNLIVISETGSGKTTLIPRVVMESYCQENHGRVVCTQPRRVAAISIAQHVARQINCNVGGLVGYTVRYEDMTSDESRLVFATDGSLLRESISDPYLQRYTYIIIDEAHERSLHTDILFGVVKKAQLTRHKAKKAPLKIIIMSATITADKFEQFFNAKTFYIPGRQHPIDYYYMKSDPVDYFNACFTSTIQLHKELPIECGILVFLTGQDEIESMRELLGDFCKNYDLTKVELCPLYAALSSHHQLKVFNPTPKDTRKIVLATNIAETSITIPGIHCVIDSGVVKLKRFCPNTNIETLVVTSVSRAQARQRAGRAGRLGHGRCYRLFCEHTFFNKLHENNTPEVLRCNLSYVSLVLISMGINDILNFPWFDQPDQTTIRASLEKLKSLGAINSQYQITNLGSKMIKFPLDPTYSRCIVAACTQDSCTDEIVTIVALLNEENLLYSSKSDSVNSNSNHFAIGDCRLNFSSFDGDLIMLFNLWNSYQTNISQCKKLNKPLNVVTNEWCAKYKVNPSCWRSAAQARTQLIKILLKSGYTLNNSSGLSPEKSSESIRRLMFHGFYMNCAQLQPDGKTYLTLQKKQLISIHPASCIFQKKTEFVFFTDIIETNRKYMRNVSRASIEWLTSDNLNFKAYFTLNDTKLSSVSNSSNLPQNRVIYS